jgi:hypothetical protein
MKKISLLTFLFFLSSYSFGQDFEGDPNAGTGVPIDGGIVTITLIAAAYGAKRHKENKDKSL